MVKIPVLLNKTLVIGCIGISVIIVLASFPSVFASRTHQSLSITYKIREQLVKNLKNIKSDSTLGWSPGFILNIFFITLKLYIDYLRNNSWFPGLTLIMGYLFLVLVLLSLISTP